MVAVICLSLSLLFLSHGVSCDVSGDGLNLSPPVDVLVDAKGEILGFKLFQEVI